MAYYQNLMQFYEDRVGQWIDAWLLENPGSVVAVIEAEDVESDQGKFLWPWISFDYDEDDPSTQTGRHFEDDLNLHVFYVDIDRPKEQETTYDDGSDDEKWPKEGAGGLYWDPNDLYLHTDGSAFGEHSVWIIPINCDNFTYGSARFRIRDDCENWRRSEDVGTGTDFENINVEVVVASPSVCVHRYNGLGDYRSSISFMLCRDSVSQYWLPAYMWVDTDQFSGAVVSTGPGTPLIINSAAGVGDWDSGAMIEHNFGMSTALTVYGHNYWLIWSGFNPIDLSQGGPCSIYDAWGNTN